MDAEFLEKEISDLKEKISDLQEKGKIKIANFKKYEQELKNIQEEIPKDSQIIFKLMIKLETYQELLNKL
jgi:peptidoglycan hydrolase CwlO-like protein